MALFVKMGHNLPGDVAARRRAAFLQSLMGKARAGLNGLPLIVSPCSAVEAYLLFIAICGALGIPIEEAAIKLENLIRSQA